MHFIGIVLFLHVIYINKTYAQSFSFAKLDKYDRTPVILPVSSPTFLPQFPFHGTRPLQPVPTGPLEPHLNFNAHAYPPFWKTPDSRHREVQAAIRAINWDYVPKLARHLSQNDTYEIQKAEGCWETNKLCSTPKVTYLPNDIIECARPYDFGLTFDDGPLITNASNRIDRMPYLYDFLASLNQTATLFMIGSNIVDSPQAALRAFQSGHTLCAHTWSHTHMTMLTNEQIVAELYWTIRAIKEATGVTTRCWRPSYGDVDDRVRAIAHQLGLRTITWNSDSLDWYISLADDAEDFIRDEVDAAFKSWISAYQSGNQTHGRIVLMHESTHQTIKVARKWIPRLKKVFRVMKVHDCVPHIGYPYWESS